MSRYKWINKQQFIDLGKKIYKKYGILYKTYFIKKMKINGYLIDKFFDSFDKFVIESNIKIKKSKYAQKNILKNDILNRIKVIDKNIPITRYNFYKVTGITIGKINKFFYNIENFSNETQIKFKIKSNSKFSKKDCINFLQELNKEQGPLKIKDLRGLHKKYPIYNIESLRVKFGSWENLEKELGFKFINSKRKKLTKENIKNEFIKVIKKNGIFKQKNFDKIMPFSSGVVGREFGSLENLLKETNLFFKRSKQTKLSAEYMIYTSKKVFKKYGLISQREFNKKIPFDLESARKKFGSIKKFIKYANIKFISPNFASYGIGKNETQILDDYEKLNNVKLERQFPIWNGKGYYKIDGYDSINNIAYEVDESFHMNQKIEDQIREQNITNKIGCKFVRINEQVFLQQMNGQKSLENFNLGDING